MAHFAELNADNIVIKVAVVNNDKIKDSNGNESEALGIAFCKNHRNSTNTWVQTSYNTRGGVHSLGGTPLRKNYAGKGYKYYPEHDLFAPPSPYVSWVLNTSTGLWGAPTTAPTLTDEQTAANKIYVWNETNYQANNANGWELVDKLVL
jgi:hypothetical protein